MAADGKSLTDTDLLDGEGYDSLPLPQSISCGSSVSGIPVGPSTFDTLEKQLRHHKLKDIDEAGEQEVLGLLR